MRHLQEAFEAYRDQGLVVVGVDCSDDPRIARQFLAENGATFPTVLDGSPATREVVYRRYQTLTGMSAVPLSYVIDREGRIAASWYGRHDKERLRKVLEGLGLEGR
jgi:peroxiredoxin